MYESARLRTSLWPSLLGRGDLRRSSSWSGHHCLPNVRVHNVSWPLAAQVAERLVSSQCREVSSCLERIPGDMRSDEDFWTAQQRMIQAGRGLAVEDVESRGRYPAGHDRR